MNKSYSQEEYHELLELIEEMALLIRDIKVLRLTRFEFTKKAESVLLRIDEVIKKEK